MLAANKLMSAIKLQWGVLFMNINPRLSTFQELKVISQFQYDPIR
jgi:hypothetical protein